MALFPPLADKQELGVELVNLKRLRKGQFFIQSGSYRPLKLKVPTYLLKDRNTMHLRHWKNLIESNLLKYYAPIAKTKRENAQLKDKATQDHIMA